MTSCAAGLGAEAGSCAGIAEGKAGTLTTAVLTVAAASAADRSDSRTTVTANTANTVKTRRVWRGRNAGNLIPSGWEGWRSQSVIIAEPALRTQHGVARIRGPFRLACSVESFGSASAAGMETGAGPLLHRNPRCRRQPQVALLLDPQALRDGAAGRGRVQQATPIAQPPGGSARRHATLLSDRRREGDRCADRARCDRVRPPARIRRGTRLQPGSGSFGGRQGDSGHRAATATLDKVRERLPPQPRNSEPQGDRQDRLDQDRPSALRPVPRPAGLPQAPPRDIGCLSDK